VHFELRDNAANLPPDYVAAMEQTKTSRPAWYRSFVVGEWGAFSGQAFEEFEPRIHVVDPFPVPDWWRRFESMDHGAANPTAWFAWAADGDGNLIVFGEHYQAGWHVSRHAAEILRLREEWHPADVRGRVTCWADPSTGARVGWRALKWSPASVKTEYAEHGVTLVGANNDREAGYARLLELLHVESGRVAPPWADVPASVGGAPRLYVFRSCRNLIDQLRSAPLEDEGVSAGRAVDAAWETEQGHATAGLRYGALSWERAAVPPRQPLEDPRAEFIRKVRDRTFKEAAMASSRPRRSYIT
jgi:hypothetical protein